MFSLWSSPVTSITYPSFSFLVSLSLIIQGIEEGTGDQCETERNCTWRARLAHLFSIHFLSLSPILLSLSFSFLGIEEGTCRFEVADSRTGLADMPIFSLYFCFSIYFFSFATTLLTKASFLSSFSFSLLFTLLFLWSFWASKKGQETNVRKTVPDIPALPTFSLSTFLALPPSFCPSPSLFWASRKGHAGSKWQTAEQAQQMSSPCPPFLSFLCCFHLHFFLLSSTLDLVPPSQKTTFLLLFFTVFL